MSNYRRLISYIYAYEGTVKGKNIGFAKLEARNGQCRISVSVKKVYVGANDLGVYLLSDSQEIFLGRIFIRSGVGEFRTVVRSDNVEESGRSLDDCYGLSVHDVQDRWRSYATVWEDRETGRTEDAVAYAAEVELAGMTSENLMGSQGGGTNGLFLTAPERWKFGELEEMNGAEPSPAEPSQAAEPPSAEPPQVPEPPAPEPSPAPEPEVPRPPVIEPTPAAPPVIEPTPAAPPAIEPTPAAPPVTEPTPAAPPVTEPICAPAEGPVPPGNLGLASAPASPGATSPARASESPVGSTSARPPESRVQPSEPQVRPPESREQPSAGGGAGQEAALPGEPREEPEATGVLDPAPDPEKIWDMFRKHYPKIDAFDYENGCEILKICPQDIGLLPRENWTYGNNSFLLHGYYNYHCLILVRLDNPRGRARFLLGVPGHYFSNEKYMASMFGFPHFVLSKKQPLDNGRFGYWYTDVRLGQ